MFQVLQFRNYIRVYRKTEKGFLFKWNFISSRNNILLTRGTTFQRDDKKYPVSQISSQITIFIYTWACELIQTKILKKDFVNAVTV